MDEFGWIEGDNVGHGEFKACGNSRSVRVHMGNGDGILYLAGDPLAPQPISIPSPMLENPSRTEDEHKVQVYLFVCTSKDLLGVRVS